MVCSWRGRTERKAAEPDQPSWSAGRFRSVVKELVENAIDAKATAVTVEIKEGGISFIRITDNVTCMSMRLVLKGRVLQYRKHRLLDVRSLCRTAAETGSRSFREKTE